MPKYNIVMIGDVGCGKTSLVSRFVDDVYPITSDVSGVMGGVSIKNRTIDDTKFTITDVNGFDNHSGASFRLGRQDAAVFVFDLGNFESFNKLKSSLWTETTRYMRGKNFILVGAKSELKCAVDESAAKAFADENGMQYIKCSAEKGENVDLVFKTLAEEMQKSKAPAVEPAHPAVIDVMGDYTAKVASSRRDSCCLVM